MEALRSFDIQTLLQPAWGLFVLGVVLLLFGRRLVWLALVGLGCLLGLVVAEQLLPPSAATEPLVRLGLVMLLAVGGALLAVFAQKVAVAVAGFVLGALGTVWLLEAIGYGGEPWVILAALGGAVVGFLLGRFLFAMALTVASSAIGASLMLEPFVVAPELKFWIFLSLCLFGILAQTSRRRRAPRAL